MKGQQIIIKKVKKKGGAGGHGGAWKVAYADFVTAMMAFFLMMWLLNMTSSEKRARISQYFKTYSIFQTGGASTPVVFKEGGPLTSGEQESKGQTTGSVQVPEPGNLPAFGQGGEGLGRSSAETFKESIKQAIETKLGDIKDQVMVDIYEGGVRIQLVDTEGKTMFDVGSSRPTGMAMRILQVIGDNVRALPNPVAIEGHTDALAYKSTAYGNWELSTERALTARKELEKLGLESSRLTKVAGYADTVPLIKENPRDPRNRRISIILLFPQRATTPPPAPPGTNKQ